MFGNNNMGGGGGLFGGAGAANTGGGGLFGNQQNNQQQQGGMMGQQQQQGGGLFGGNTGATNTGGNTGLFGGGQQPQQQQQQGGGLFGGANTNPIGMGGQQQQGNTGLFGGGGNATNPQGGFMTNQNNNTMGGGGLFGNTNTNTNSQTTGGLFGTNTQAQAGQQQQGGGLFGGGGFGQQTNQQQGGIMGQNQNQQQGGGLFGGGGNTQQQGGGGLFGGQQNTQQQQGGGLFGGGVQQQQNTLGGGGGGLFGGGGNTNTGNTMGGGLFGGGGQQQQNTQQQGAGGMFGAGGNTQQQGGMMGGNNGYQRMQGYKPYQSSNTNLNKNGVVPYINCISAHPQFNNNFCMNEIRLLDYMDIKSGKLNPNQLGQNMGNTQSGGMFGGQQQQQPQQQNAMGGGLFGGGGTNTTQTTGGGLFGGGGQTQNQQQGTTGGGLFGPSQNAGTNATQTGTGGGLFGGGGGNTLNPQNNNQNQNQNQTGGLFGGGGTTTGGGGLFGGGGATTQQPATGAGGGLFGGGGAQQQQTTGGGLFGGGGGQQQTSTGGGGLFGGGAQQQNTGGGLFGGGAQQQTGGGGLFGGGGATQQNTGGGLFGGGAQQQQQQGMAQNNAQMAQPGISADSSQIIKQLTELVQTMKLQQQPQNPRMGGNSFSQGINYDDNAYDRREPYNDSYQNNQYQRFGYGEGRDEPKLFTNDRFQEASRSSLFSNNFRQNIDPYSSKSLITSSQRQSIVYNRPFEPQNNLIQQKRDNFFKNNKSSFKDLSSYRQNDFQKLKQQKLQKISQQSNLKSKSTLHDRQSLFALNKSTIEQREFIKSQLSEQQQLQNLESNSMNSSLNTTRAFDIFAQNNNEILLSVEISHPISKIFEIPITPQNQQHNFKQIIDFIRFQILKYDDELKEAVVDEKQLQYDEADNWYKQFLSNPVMILKYGQNKVRVIQQHEKVQNFVQIFSQKDCILEVREKEDDYEQEEELYQEEEIQQQISNRNQNNSHNYDNSLNDELDSIQQNINLGHFELINPENLNEIQDLTQINNFTIRSQYIEIRWLEALDLSQGINLEESIKDNQNEITIEDQRLNKKASIIFFNFCKNFMNEIPDITYEEIKENSLQFAEEIGIRPDTTQPEFEPSNDQWNFYGIVEKFFDEEEQ